MSDCFTCIEIAFYPEYMNYWLRFGAPDVEFDLDRRRALACFLPGRKLGYIRWIANEYGTQKWRFTVMRTVGALQPLTRIDGVHPGGQILLETSGVVKVKQALAQIDWLEGGGFELAEVSDSYFRHVHNRIAIRQPIRSYTSAQHDAIRAARRVLP